MICPKCKTEIQISLENLEESESTTECPGCGVVINLTVDNPISKQDIVNKIRKSLK